MAKSDGIFWGYLAYFVLSMAFWSEDQFYSILAF